MNDYKDRIFISDDSARSYPNIDIVAQEKQRIIAKYFSSRKAVSHRRSDIFISIKMIRTNGNEECKSFEEKGTLIKVNVWEI